MILLERFTCLNTLFQMFLMSSIDITRLKEFALQLPADHPLHKVLLIEKDRLTGDEFLSRIDLWLKLSAIHL